LFNEFLPYFSPRVNVAFRYEEGIVGAEAEAILRKHRRVTSVTFAIKVQAVPDVIERGNVLNKTEHGDGK
jgi:hypothetical protein